jgi:hypothetical protein
MIRYELMLRGNVVEVILDVAEPEDYGQVEFRRQSETSNTPSTARPGSAGI